MFKSLKIGVLVIVMVLLSGCMNVDVKMQVNSDKSLDIAIVSKMDILEYMKIIFSDEDMWRSGQIDALTKDCENTCNNEVTCVNTCVNNIVIPEFNDDNLKKYLDIYMKDNNIEEAIISEEEIKEMEDNGYIVETSFENYVYTLNIKKHYNNIDEVSTNKEEDISFNNLFSGDNEALFIKTNNSYKVNYVYSLEDLESDNEYQDIMGDLNLNDFIKYTYEISLPTKSISNNATSINNDGKTLNWVLDENNNKINYEFAFVNNNSNNSNKLFSIDNYLSYAFIGGGAILLVGGIVGLVITSKHKN